MLPVVAHAVQAVAETGWVADVVCLLQPTFPFRRPDDIDACIDLLRKKGADCVISVHRVPHRFNPHWVYLQKPDGSLELATGGIEPIPRRQELPPAFHRSGAVYVSRADVITKRGTLYGERVVGFETSTESACNIDTEADWQEAEAMVERWRAHAAG
jgi:CMP-N-acetylneuraminic acid synthetase